LLSEEPTRLEDMYAPAATGLLFAPGAGVADLMGQAPDPSRPGEMLPSFYENITGGNYLDAGLQALGGAGDAVQMMGAAFPPAVAVGAAMKAPRGIRVASNAADIFPEVKNFPSLTKSEERVVAASSAPPEQVAGLGRVVTEPIDPQNMEASRTRFNELQKITSGYEQERAKARIVRLDDGTDAIQYMEPPATVQSVPISQLKATQPGLLSGGDAPLTEGPPLVVKKGGEFFVRDGHHRLARMIEAGADVADVRVVDLDAGGLLGVDAPRGIRAFHGSPYDFDKFNLDKIGTGEGAQAYGRGLYFAEAEPTAMAYRDTLSAAAKGRSSLKYDGDRIKDLSREDATEGQELKDQILDKIAGEMSFFDQKPENVINRKIKMLEADAAEPLVKTGDPEVDEISELTRLSELRQLEVYKSLDPEKFKRGVMYEVNIDANPDEMLDWQAPYKDQSEAVKKAIDDAGYKPDDERTPGFLIHQRIVEDYSDMDSFDNPYANPEADAANILLEAGIPGIKYLDAGSRTADASAPSRTSNYVVFDDATIEIMRKYGLLAPLVGAGTVAAVSDMGEDRGLLEM
jgi:hypothetical protein